MWVFTKRILTIQLNAKYKLRPVTQKIPQFKFNEV